MRLEIGNTLQLKCLGVRELRFQKPQESDLKMARQMVWISTGKFMNSVNFFLTDLISLLPSPLSSDLTPSIKTRTPTIMP